MIGEEEREERVLVGQDHDILRIQQFVLILLFAQVCGKRWLRVTFGEMNLISRKEGFTKYYTFLLLGHFTSVEIDLNMFSKVSTHFSAFFIQKVKLAVKMQ